MPQRHPVYVVGSDSPTRARLAAALHGWAPRFFESLEAFEGSEPEPGMAFLLEAGLTAEAVLRAVERLAVGRGEWTPVLVREDGGTLVGRTLSAGYLHPVADAFPPDGALDPSVFLELRAVLRDISQARHDINNPLTSALAETQLLLMDAGEGELREGLETVQEQLRRIRDLVAGTVHLRPLD